MTFSSFPIGSLDISPQHKTACEKAGLFTASDILLPSPADLNKKLKFTRLEHVHELVKSVSRAIVPKCHTFPRQDELEGNEGISVKLEGEWIRTGDAGLDTALGGGLRVGTITEIAGESAAGKSHFCLLLALSAQIPALSTNPGAVMILTSEREIATDRMMDLAQHLISAHLPHESIKPEDLLDDVLSNIVSDVMALDHTLTYKVPHILRERLGTGPSPLMGQYTAEGYNGGKERTVRLIIVDSITALIRGADSNYNSTSIGLTERSRHLCSVSDKLKAIAVEFGLAIVIINQVTDVFARLPIVSNTPTGPASSPMLSQFYSEGNDPPMLYSTQSRWFSGQSDTLKKEASLGIVWANAVNVRIMLSRTGRRRMVDPKDLSKRRKKRSTQEEEEAILPGKAVEPIIDDTQPTLIRRAHVVFSPFAPPSTIDYIISPTGIHSLPDSYRLIDIAETLKRRRKMKMAILGDKEAEEDKEGGVLLSSQTSEAVEGQQGDGEAGGDGGTRRDGQLEQDVADDGEFEDDVYDEYGDLPLEWWQGNVDALYTEPLAEGGDI